MLQSKGIGRAYRIHSARESSRVAQAFSSTATMGESG